MLTVDSTTTQATRITQVWMAHKAEEGGASNPTKAFLEIPTSMAITVTRYLGHKAPSLKAWLTTPL